MVEDEGLLHRIAHRQRIDDHDGASGAVLERAVLDDGTRLVLKTFDPAHDLTMGLTGRTVPVDVDLWRTGVLDRLPPALGHAVRGAWLEDDRWVLAMDDLSGRLLSFESRLDREQYRTIIAAAAALHATDTRVEASALWPVEDRVTQFAPRTMAPLVDGPNPLPAWCLQGWAAWDDLAPADVRELVARVHARPTLLNEPLRQRGPVALLHGDYWTPNLALDGDRVVVIDWALATVGPPVLEFVSFLAGCAAQVAATREELLDDLRAAWGPRHDEDALRLGLLFGVVEMGWNMAWHLTATPSPRTTDELDWWVEAARRAATVADLG